LWRGSVLVLALAIKRFVCASVGSGSFGEGSFVL